MLREIDFISSLHKSTKRDYLARVNDKKYPKGKAASLAKDFGYDYWDGDRRICYGGYKYIPGRWTKLAQDFIEFYKLTTNSKILDIGCGKGYLLYEIKLLIPEISIFGIDISKYALKNSKQEIKEYLTEGNATNLPWEDNFFDFVFSINTLHCLPAEDLFKALKEMERVGKKNKYLCVESFRNEYEKANLLYWQVTCGSFHSPKTWLWWYEKNGYKGDYSFIFFE